MRGSGAGISTGQLQRMRTNVAKWAALAGALAGAAHWPDMESVLTALAQLAAAGARAELLPLLKALLQGLEFGAKSWLKAVAGIARTS